MKELDITVQVLNDMVNQYKNAPYMGNQTEELKKRFKYCREGLEVFKENLLKELRKHIVDEDEGTKFYRYGKFITLLEKVDE